MRSVLLADNQDITRLGCMFLLQQSREVGHIITASTKKELLAEMLENPDALVILDYTLFDFSSLNELIIFQTRFEKADWILFSDELSDDFLRILLYNTQSVSVLLKDTSEDEIRSCFKETLKGKRYICNHVSNVLLDFSKRLETVRAPKSILTVTEQEILKEMALGKTTKEIAAKRHVSAHTIMTHRKNIFRKIEVNNVHEATKYAMRAGLVDMAEYYI